MLVKHLFVANISIARLQGCTAEPVYMILSMQKFVKEKANEYFKSGLHHTCYLY